MVIDSAYVGMESARLYRSSISTRVSSVITPKKGNATGGQLSSFTEFLPKGDDSGKGKNKDEVNSEENLSNVLNKMGGIKPKNYVSRSDSGTVNAFHKMRELCIRHIFDMLFGHGISNKSYQEEEPVPGSGVDYELRAGSYELQEVTVESTFKQTYSEFEATSFTSQGMVKTSDGREISFDINVTMSRNFTSTFQTTSISDALRVVDPLVINLDVGSAEIGPQNFFFDLDCDGTKEEIASLSSKSGFLALDLNEDGIINDGSELFGTASGDGFKDLAMYDKDQNGWIDENDEIFSKLKIWVKDENGNDLLYSLKDKNVGAIYLGNVSTEYSLTRTTAERAQAIVRQTGMFLYETGEAGTVQHVDLVS